MKRSLFLLVLPVAVSVTACGSFNPTSPVVPGVSTPSGDAVTAAAEPGLLGTWTLSSMQPAGGAATSTPAGSFTAEFKGDGALHLKADCNVCKALYQAASSAIQVRPLIACTLAYCASAPLDTQYVDLTAAATAYAVSSNTLELRSVKGTLRFQR